MRSGHDGGRAGQQFPAQRLALEDLLSRLTPALERAQMPYMLTGSVASSAHGVPRSTRDVDIVIAPTRAQLLALRRPLLGPGFLNIQRKDQ
ncbi:MAG TPA: hypothetical protein VEG30_13870 [Terriglobales bacterium]|nr:hypothetical protein [Terriglobales bacterium]